MSAREDAQRGKQLIKQAILEFLSSKRDEWLPRSAIEDALGIGSDYQGSGGGKSYDGGLSAMLLSELFEGKHIRREKTGKGWLYRISQVER